MNKVIDEQEIPGASDNAKDALSPAASSGSLRARNYTFKVLEEVKYDQLEPFAVRHP